MTRGFWKSPAAWRVLAAYAAFFALAGCAVFLLSRRIVRVPGVRLTLETTAPAAVEGRIFWKNAAGERYGTNKSVAVRIPPGHGRVTAFLPSRMRIFGISAEAADVGFGAVDLVGGNVRLRADAFGDLVFEPPVMPRRFPTWRSAAP